MSTGLDMQGDEKRWNADNRSGAVARMAFFIAHLS